MDAATALRRVVSPRGETLAAGTAVAIEREFSWLAAVIAARLRSLQTSEAVGTLPETPRIDPEESHYDALIDRLELGPAERLVVALALAPHVRPELLDPLYTTNAALGRGYAEVGGVQGRAHGGFLPTAETAMFLIAGRDVSRRLECRALLEPGARLARAGLVRVEAAPLSEPWLSGMLTMDADAIDRLTLGHARGPQFSSEFPARRLTSGMEWSELVLSEPTLEALREVEAWARHEQALLRGLGLGRRLRPGYRALFCGPSGTGKTVTATLLGNRVNRPVYRVSLAAVVSKYIGETEKNLERVFERAGALGCILFFDEADALFGRRTGVADAHDRYANQEVAYLLQRVEEHPGMIVLATNLEANIDEAFLRRFHAVVRFPLPGPAERRRLWAEMLPRRCAIEPGLDLDAIAQEYEISGGAIANVVQYASLMALESGTACIRRDDVLAGVRRELGKQGRTV